MGPSAAHASFSFAQYQGKAEGVSIVWLAFWGTYTLTCNVEMWRLLIDAIDDGQTSGGLEDDIFDLVEGMDRLMPSKSEEHRSQGETRAISTRLFSLSTFNNTFTIQCRVEGLELFQSAVHAGADYQTDGGTSLYAFTGQASALVSKEKTRKQARMVSEPAPQGYVSGRRRRR